MSSTPRFFDITELVYWVTGHLETADISRLARTTRRLNTLCGPLLYRALDLTSNPQLAHLLTTPESRHALARSLRDIRSLKLSRIAIVHLFDFLMELHQDLTLSSLNKLDINLGDFGHGLNFLPFAPRSRDIFPLFSQVCWILQLSPNLIHLTAHNLPLESKLDCFSLTNLIAGFTHLKTLDVIIRFNNASGLPDWTSVWCDFLRTCPDLIERFSLTKIDSFNAYDFSEGELAEEADVEMKMERKRDGDPLVNLTTLELPCLDRETEMSAVLSALGRCPNLDTLAISRGFHDSHRRSLINLIVRCFSRLRRLHYRAPGGYSVKLPYLIMEAMAEGQLEELRQTGRPLYMDDLAVAKSAYRKHSKTLRSVDLSSYRGGNPSIGLILVECAALETLRLNLKDMDGTPPILLEDAVAKSPWACTKIRHLEIRIAGVGLPLLDTQQQTYYLHPDTTVFSAAETTKFSLLEQLYSQIGSLTNLEFLIMEIARTPIDHDSLWSWNYKKKTFPAMLTLSDEGSRRHGYLALLGGLTKLRELRGSVYANTDETKVTMEWLEAQWMASHWPKLEVAEFFRQDEDPTEPFKWLQKQYTGRQLVLSPAPLY
ncbi:hypothetical protein BGX23_012508 [Mortierella sp. AD031]|nr:hypothetical protein BGX23_012508 [Mortierella sp. AD031]